ncbi:MAG: sigma factor [Planctomycetota bacterium]
MSESEAPRLDAISTRWSCVVDMQQFALRYTPAMQTYLDAILRDEDLARDVLQDFLVKIIQRGFEVESSRAGRFRDYLTKSVRNAAISFLRKRKANTISPELLSNLEDRSSQDEDWKHLWTECLLNRTWRRLEDHQQNTSGNVYYSVLKLATDEAELSSEEAAKRLSTNDRSFNAASYRQQLRRARKLFAELLMHEVAETLSSTSRDDLMEELCDLGLMSFVEPFAS